MDINVVVTVESQLTLRCVFVDTDEVTTILIQQPFYQSIPARKSLVGDI
jgi:hypothetical protein